MQLPDLSPDQLDSLKARTISYALEHGICYGTTTEHAPISLLPSRFPRDLFDKAVALQPIFDLLYARVASDWGFLDRVTKQIVDVDSFVGALWRGWKQIRTEQQPTLGIFRSDYMLHLDKELKQVEFNTISSSFGVLSEAVAVMHRHLSEETGGYFGHTAGGTFPDNHSGKSVVEGMAAAHRVYGVPDAQILFVVQPGERNIFDQQPLITQLRATHSISVVSKTLDDLAPDASVSESGALIVKGIEISVVYFRSTYTPTDFPTEAHYTTRFLLERSRAIKCPSIPLQLAGTKKVQQVLCETGVLELFLPDVDATKVEAVRSTFMDMFTLDMGVERAKENFRNLVLKPQREGGGNNVYHTSIPAFLSSLPKSDYPAWIAMQLIQPPADVQSYLARQGEAARKEVVSELGIFGWVVFCGGKVEATGTDVGWLLRTKGKESDEGGVASGFSVVDSVVLVD